MKVFIFGAGASYASQGDKLQYRAPLTNQIFDEGYWSTAQEMRITKTDFERAQEQIKLHNNSLEEWLTAFWTETNKKNFAQKKRGVTSLW